MRVLLCAATEMEIAPTILALSQKEEHTVQLLISGVGLMACTYALTKAVVVHRPDVILQAGVAGTLTAEFPLARVVAVRSECVGDLGVKENARFRSVFDLKLLRQDAWPWMGGKLVNEGPLLKTSGLPVADGVTVNEITTLQERIAYYRDSLAVQVESMEGAAMHYIGLQEKIPFLQIRSLSNFIGERDKTKWQLKEAVANLNHELQHLLRKLNSI